MGALFLMFLKENWGKILVALFIISLAITIAALTYQKKNLVKDIAECNESKGALKTQNDELVRANDSNEKVQLQLRTEIKRCNNSKAKDSQACTDLLKKCKEQCDIEKNIKTFVDSLPCPSVGGSITDDAGKKASEFYNSLQK